VVVDGFQPTRDEFYTVACLWHTQVVVGRGEDWFVGGYDAMGPERLPGTRRLRVQSVGVADAGPRGRSRGMFPIQRHYGPEQAYYEAESRHHLAGRWNTFVSLLTIVEGSESSYPTVERVATDWGDGAICLRLVEPAGRRHTLLIKLDLERERASANIRPRTPWETATVRTGGLETDAHFLHVVETGGKLAWSATLLTRLHRDGRTLLDVPRNTFGLQLDGGPDREAQARWRRWEGEG
jgi:hypothetical protein